MMFALLSLMATFAGVVAPAPASPASLCGSADLSRGNVLMAVRILNAPADLHSPYVIVRARNEDGSYSLSVGYRPTEQGLGKPHNVHVDAKVRFASEAEARPLRLEWREPGGAWSIPVLWSTPQRHFPNEEARFSANYRMGQGEPFPHGTDVLDNMARGVRYEFRNLDEAGNVVSAGATDYPPQQVIDEMYATARRQAVARLRPCSTRQAPAVVPVAPPTPNQ
jgi:hypothetical protein